MAQYGGIARDAGEMAGTSTWSKSVLAISYLITDAAHLPQYTPAYQPGDALDYKVKQLALWRLNPNRFARTMNVSDPVTKCLYAYDVVRGGAETDSWEEHYAPLFREVAGI
jgi:hypothetical protein